MIDETLETALPRTFVVTIEPKFGYPRDGAKIMVLKGYSVLQVKKEAVRRASTGKLKHRKFHDWIFFDIKEQP